MAEDLTTSTQLLQPGILGNQPENINFLSPLGFRFILRRSPNVNFFCTRIRIPGFDLGPANLQTPFKGVPLPGDKPTFGDLVLTFKIDEDLKNYLEIFNWMAKIGFPEKFEQYASIAKIPSGTGQGIVSDGTVSILNSAMNPTTEFRFEDLWPSGLSALDFTSEDTSVNYIAADVTFKFKMMKVVPL